jgi:hypothetical protein
MAASKPGVGRRLGEIAASAKAVLQLIRKEGREAHVSTRIDPHRVRCNRRGRRDRSDGAAVATLPRLTNAVFVIHLM